MQEVSGACSLDDDMLEGDLGDGTGGLAPSGPLRKKSQSLTADSLLSRAEPRSSSLGGGAWIPGLKTAGPQQRAHWRPPCSGSLVDLSKDELKDRLQEATEVIEVLCSELEVAHRYLEGKYEALKILQGKTILDKATSHTKSLLQKSEATAKALEKEVNSLQWELSFSQVQMKKSQQSWEPKYNRILSENKALTDSLEERESEMQQLRAEHSACSRQCLELLSLLSLKEQRAYQGTKPQYSPERDAADLELAVLGACRCPGAAPCPCGRTAAASRKQLVQLQQEKTGMELSTASRITDIDKLQQSTEKDGTSVNEKGMENDNGNANGQNEKTGVGKQKELDAQHLRREEALMVADAFRIAFEQQLRKRSDHFLLRAEGNAQHSKAEGANRSPLMSVSQRLRGLLPSKTSEDLLETLYRLLDLGLTSYCSELAQVEAEETIVLIVSSRLDYCNA
ncbi:coiled-coil domain-containing protein 125 isoform X2 [Gymnodraco acuticeps]|uniref:Coiled-coil domain-containing protein 125 isoform X2 n=1 Tax=Gymnodraco acuticeps TaxID=8218 RepID=A0A6P8SWA0_GYMAC|nr:coiled-coil domain-containing protein 125 isoform X2 [Gymnodraco acuticeps]